VPDDYSSTKFHEQWRRLLTAARAAMPNTQVLFKANFLKPECDLAETMAVCASAGCTFSGPDILPNENIDAYDILRGAVCGTDYRGKVAIAPFMEAAGLGGKQGNYLPKEIYAFAKNTLHANYVIWRRNTWYGDPDQQWEDGILPLIRANPKLHTDACPSNMTCKVD
jgi:hypothetical protein